MFSNNEYANLFADSDDSSSDDNDSGSVHENSSGFVRKDVVQATIRKRRLPLAGVRIGRSGNQSLHSEDSDSAGRRSDGVEFGRSGDRSLSSDTSSQYSCSLKRAATVENRSLSSSSSSEDEESGKVEKRGTGDDQLSSSSSKKRRAQEGWKGGRVEKLNRVSGLGSCPPLFDRIQASIQARDDRLFAEAVNDFHFLVGNHVAQYHTVISYLLELPEDQKRTFLTLACGASAVGSISFVDVDNEVLKDLMVTYLTHRAVATVIDEEGPDRVSISPILFGLMNERLQRVSKRTSFVDRALSLNLPTLRRVMSILIRSGRLPYLKMRLQAAPLRVNEIPDPCTDLAGFLESYNIQYPDENSSENSLFPFSTRLAALTYIGREHKGVYLATEELPLRDHKRIDFKEICCILLSLEEVLKETYDGYKVGCTSKTKKKREQSIGKITSLVTNTEITKAIKLAVSRLAAKNEQLPSTQRDLYADSHNEEDGKAKARQELNYDKAAQASSGNHSRYVSEEKRNFNVKRYYDRGNLILEAQSYEMKGFVDKLNELSIPLDLLFPAGRTLRAKLGLNPNGPEDVTDCSKVGAKLIFLLRPQDRKGLSDSGTCKRVRGSKQAKDRQREVKPHIVAPAVISISQPICQDLKRKLLEFHNSERHIRDSTASGRAYLRVPFSIRKLAGVVFPLVSMGANKAVLATVAKSADLSMIGFANEVQNVIINLTNRGVADIRGETPPRPDIGPTADAFYDYISRIRRNVDVGGFTYTFPDDSYEVFNDTGYLDEARAFVDTESSFIDPIASMMSTVEQTTQDIPAVRIVSGPDAGHPAYLPNRLDNASINRISASAHYYRHQDCCEERGNQLISNISYGKVYTQSNPSVSYPTNEQMIVLSWIIGEDSMAHKTAVDWWLGKFWLGGCITDCNNWHIQLAGVQYYGIQHSSGFLRLSGGRRSSGSRYIMTFRFMIDPNSHPQAYLEALSLDHLLPSHIRKRKITVLGDYQFLNVGDRAEADPSFQRLRQKPWLSWGRAEVFTDTRGKDYIDLMDKKADGLFRQRFVPKRCNKFIVPSLSQLNKFHREKIPPLPCGTLIPRDGLKKPIRTIAVGRSPMEVVYHRTIVDHALSESKILSVYDTDDVILPFQPLWLFNDRPCLPGIGLQTFDIPLKINNQKKELINAIVPFAFQATKLYKNRIPSYESHLRFWKRLHARCVDEFEKANNRDNAWLSSTESAIEKEFEEAFADLFFEPLRSMGSGGSNQPTGATASQFDTLRNDAPHTTVGGPQSLQAPTNEALTSAFRQQNPIAIF